MKNIKKGFTIVELVIVIAVIAILASVLIPTFSTVISNANETAAMEQANNTKTAVLVLTRGVIPDNSNFYVLDGNKKDSGAKYVYGFVDGNLTRKDEKKEAAPPVYKTVKATVNEKEKTTTTYVAYLSDKQVLSDKEAQDAYKTTADHSSYDKLLTEEALGQIKKILGDAVKDLTTETVDSFTEGGTTVTDKVTVKYSKADESEGESKEVVVEVYWSSDISNTSIAFLAGTSSSAE